MLFRSVTGVGKKSRTDKRLFRASVTVMAAGLVGLLDVMGKGWLGSRSAQVSNKQSAASLDRAQPG